MRNLFEISLSCPQPYNNKEQANEALLDLKEQKIRARKSVVNYLKNNPQN